MDEYAEPPLHDDGVSTIGSASGFVYVNTFPSRQRRRMRSEVFAEEQNKIHAKSETFNEQSNEHVDERLSEIFSSVTVESVKSSGFLEVEENRSVNYSKTLSEAGDELTANAGSMELCEKCTSVDRDHASHYCPQCNMKLCVCCFREHAKWLTIHEPKSLSRWNQNDPSEKLKTEYNKIAEDAWMSTQKEMRIEPAQNIGSSFNVGQTEMIPVQAVGSSHAVATPRSMEYSSKEDNGLAFDGTLSQSQYSINIKDAADKQTCCIIDMCVLNTDTIVTADTANCKLTEIQIKTMKKKRSYSLKDYPRAVSHIRNMCLLVAYPQGKLAYINLNDGSQWSSQIQLEGQECSSICVNKGKIYVSITKGINVYDISSECLHLQYDFNIEYGEIMSSTQRITVSGDIVIVSDPNNGLLFINTQTDTICNEIKMSDKPTALCLGSACDFYVACAKAVVCIKDDVVIRRFGMEFGLYAPFAVCFVDSTEFKHLFVSQWSRNNLECIVL
ncbi:hypothetical protein DPMN_162661 [Dreissena polymorpha]|uniref:B box-type domain-containing protein n=1 Tax=Dreissena polymorpha TaxID=45954 RepID=A0A9D4EVI1_DREPO|nr:hypothetical protein DPMN_162661 [Dreissena polymorpha]